jgi:hypothetical protein
MAATLHGVAAISGELHKSKAAAANRPLKRNFVVILLPIVIPLGAFL